MKRLRQAALMSLFAGNEEMEEYYRDYSGKGCAQCRRGSGPEGCQCVSVDGGGWGGGGEGELSSSFMRMAMDMVTDIITMIMVRDCFPFLSVS